MDEIIILIFIIGLLNYGVKMDARLLRNYNYLVYINYI